jgi:hypothetical protein
MRKPFGPRPIAELLPGALGEAATKRGFAGAELLGRWPAIAGGDIARHTRPVRLQWAPRGEATDPDKPPPAAVLHIRVDGAFALELQYATEQLIERINAYLGWRCVGAIRMRQGPVHSGENGAPSLPPLPEDAARRLDASLGGVEEKVLANSLRRLGQAVLRRS